MTDAAIDLHNYYAGIDVGDTVTDPDGLVSGLVLGFGTITTRHWPCCKILCLTSHRAGMVDTIVGQAVLVKKGQTND